MSIAIHFIHNKYSDKLVAGKALKLYSATIDSKKIQIDITHKNHKNNVKNSDLVIFIKSNLIGITEEIISSLINNNKQSKKSLLCKIDNKIAIAIIDKSELDNIKSFNIKNLEKGLTSELGVLDELDELGEFDELDKLDKLDKLTNKLDNKTYCTLDNENLKLISNISDLIKFEQNIQQALRNQAISKGIFMQDPNSVFMCYDTEFAANVVIEPNVYFGPKVKIANNVCIKAFSYIEDVTIGEKAIIGPYARIRGTSKINKGAKIGNFVEVKNSIIGERTKASHLSYIGDANIGNNVNIGAGTITCNYDGQNKHKTNIGQNSFIGANNLLIAPVSVGKNSMIGAGCIINNDIPDKMFVCRQTQQKIKSNNKEL